MRILHSHDLNKAKTASRLLTTLALLSVWSGPLQAQTWSDASPHEVRSIVVAPDVTLEVLDWGGSGEVLVFLAGLSMNAHTFDDFAPRFTDSFRVFGITRRGHGASTWPDAGYTLPRLVDDIRAVLDSLGVSRAIFAGHSFAGAEMTRLAAAHPDRVAGLIYIDAVQALNEVAGLMQTCPGGAEFEAAAERQFRNVEAFRNTQRRRREDGTLEANASPAGLGQIVAGLAPREYSAVRAPALAVSYVPERIEDIFLGLASPSQECVSGAQRMTYGGIAAFAEGMQRATLVALQNSQHNIHLVTPDVLETAMRQWLTGRSRR